MRKERFQQLRFPLETDDKPFLSLLDRVEYVTDDIAQLEPRYVEALAKNYLVLKRDLEDSKFIPGAEEGVSMGILRASRVILSLLEQQALIRAGMTPQHVKSSVPTHLTHVHVDTIAGMYAMAYFVQRSTIRKKFRYSDSDHPTLWMDPKNPITVEEGEIIGSAVAFRDVLLELGQLRLVDAIERKVHRSLNNPELQ